MAVPIRHVADVGQLSNEEMIDLIKAVDFATRSSYAAWFTSSSWGKANIGTKVLAGGRAALILSTKKNSFLFAHLLERVPALRRLSLAYGNEPVSGSQVSVIFLF